MMIYVSFALCGDLISRLFFVRDYRSMDDEFDENLGGEPSRSDFIFWLIYSVVSMFGAFCAGFIYVDVFGAYSGW